MSDFAEIRRLNLRALKKSAEALSSQVGGRYSYWSEMLRDGTDKSFGEKIARKIEDKLDLPPRWLDEDHGPPSPAAPAPTSPWSPAPAPPLTPVAVANALCDLIERLDDDARERVWGRLSTAAHAPDSQDARAKLAAELQPVPPPTRLTPTPAPAAAPLSQKQHRTGTK